MLVVEGLVAVAAAGACPAEATPIEVAALLDQAEAAFAALDIPRFLERTDQVRAAVPCLGSVPEPALVARVDRTEGLRLFGERNVDAVRAFAAARNLAPDYRFPVALVPPGSPILADYGAMDLTASDPETLPQPLTGALYVDGHPSRERDRAWPTLVQLVVDGAPTWSVYLAPDGVPPAYAAATAPAAPLADVAPRRPERRPLVWVTGASALATALTYAGAWGERARWADPTTPDDRLQGLRSRANTLSVLAGAGAVATVGLGAAVVITW